MEKGEHVVDRWVEVRQETGQELAKADAGFEHPCGVEFVHSQAADVEANEGADQADGASDAEAGDGNALVEIGPHSASEGFVRHERVLAVSSG